MILLPYQNGFSIDKYLETIVYLILANDVLLAGYYIHKPSLNHSRQYFNITTYKNKNFIWIFILVLYIMYLYNSLPTALAMFKYGRSIFLGNAVGGGNAFSLFISSIGLILPAIIAYYYKYLTKKNVYISLIWAMPIVIVLYMEGTRFHLLYSIIPYLILIGLFNIEKSISMKKNLILLVLLICIGISSIVIRSNRSTDNINTINKKDVPILVKTASYMSPEGTVKMSNVAENYFHTHPHTYGKETAFILYFWIPRAIWPEKPTQIGYWFIREFENVVESHSVSLSFTGELRADFGWFSLIFILLLGMLMKKGDVFIEELFGVNNNSVKKIFAAFLYPYVFFVVRSLITASMYLIYVLIMYFIFCVLFTATNKKIE